MPGRALPLWTLVREGLPEVVEDDAVSATDRLVGRLACSNCSRERATGIYFPRHALCLCTECYDDTDSAYKTQLGGPPKL